MLALIGGLALGCQILALPAQAGVVVTGAAITGDKTRTEFSMTLSQGVTVEVFTLANPYRVILDMPDVTFELPKDAGQSGQGLISAYRYGLFAARKSRVVIDTVSPVSIEKAEMTAAPGGAVKLLLSLKSSDAASFGAGTGASRTASRPVQADLGRGADSPRPSRRTGRPVVVIDPGHGGVDPGALGASNVYEKDVVLAAALELFAELEKLDRFDVVLTRSTDVFVSLDDRLEFSRSRSADLFVSLHADAIADKRFTSQVRGATVYTLSDRASDEAARRMAEKENSADAIAGLPVLKEEEEGGVRDILIDLVKRETANFSMDASNSLVGRLKQATQLSAKPQRAAAFKVLRQTGTPSVLVELGYLSNKDDEKRLSSESWRRKVAESLAAAISAYFDRRTALAP
ncbi:MAG: N-acetylmuramoyl-L-alanine amidase [Alphaproteobacteria bacterium]|nr:N-acetylmuramoyl-L-alanine amidase [Alphaproteobacteria bacterium]